MTAFARKLSVRLEFFLVLVVGFGPFIAMQHWNAVQRKPLHMTDAGLIAFPIIELILFATILWIGRVRGWSIAKFGFKISWRGTVGGIILFAVAETAMIGVTAGMQILNPEQTPFTFSRLALLPIILISLMNPVFEELLGTGYFIGSLQSLGMWPAVMASAIFRGAYHLQFGINAAASIFALGAIFGFVYWRWRQLWPLVIAHTMADLIAFTYGSYHAA
jgi:membrane protease YdiL (CAAX protease family)